jgi:hypothetical protein
MDFVCFWLVVTAAAVLCSAHESSLEIPPAKQILLMDFAAKFGVDKAGLVADLERTVEIASNFRGAPGTIEDVILWNRLILKICFPDGDCWAAKVADDNSFLDILFGSKALRMLEIYCPDIPVPKFKGLGGGEHFISQYTEWAEGEVLSSRATLIEETGEVSIPPQVVTSLAEFVFNLSTCGIPHTTRIFPKFEFSKYEVQESQIDRLSRVVPPFLRPPVMNATTWARREFIRFYLLPDSRTPDPYDALDVLLLLAWVAQAFSAPDLLNDPLALHYWDLSFGNIIVNEANQIW